MAAAHTYDDIGVVYAQHRRADPRIAQQIRLALGDARALVNVGAGTGSYEPGDLDVVAVEPSAVMLAQRPAVQDSTDCHLVGKTLFLRKADEGFGTLLGGTLLAA